jgi:vacuolar-type H+-ATPase subunit H
MEHMIKKIISMDKEAQKYKEDSMSRFEENQIAFEIEVENLKDNFIKELQEEKNKLMKLKMMQASEEAKNIKAKYEEDYDELNREYLMVRDKIVEESFNEIRDSFKRSF